MAERVRYTIEGGVADVRLNRPEKRNAIDLAMFHALIDAGEALRGDSTLRAVVLSGEGKSFCAGLDVGVFASMSGEKGEGAGAFVAGALAHRGDEIASVAQHAVTIWGSVEVPVVAAVHGHAFGGGLQLALGADIRIVAPDAQLSVLEIRWGLIPDMTATQVLPALVGLDVAKELTFTGRMVSGEEAHRLGLATRLSDDPRTDALDLAREIAGRSPAAVRAAKALLNLAGRVGFEEGLLAEQRAQRRLIGAADQVEAMVAYLEQRPPRWGERSPIT
jgi:enoyl-CoA hydratase/carnithine racemase